MSVISSGSNMIQAIFSSITNVANSIDKGINYGAAAMDMVRAKQIEAHATELEAFIVEDKAEKTKRIQTALDTISDPKYAAALAYLEEKISK